MILAELDATDARNWANRKWNAFRAAGGNQGALDQHTVRLVTNKLYQGWRNYLQSNGLQGTGDDLSGFIGQFGGNHLQQLRQQFPWLSQDVSFNEPEQLPPPEQKQSPEDISSQETQQEPEQGEDQQTTPQPTDQQRDEWAKDSKLYASFQKDANTISQMFSPMATPPTQQQASDAITSLIRNYWGKSPKADKWVTMFINGLRGNSGVINVLPNIENLDPEVWTKEKFGDPVQAEQNSLSALNKASTPEQVKQVLSNRYVLQAAEKWALDQIDDTIEQAKRFSEKDPDSVLNSKNVAKVFGIAPAILQKVLSARTGKVYPMDDLLQMPVVQAMKLAFDIHLDKGGPRSDALRTLTNMFD